MKKRELKYFEKKYQKICLFWNAVMEVWSFYLYIADDFVAHINNLKCKCFQITSGIWRTTVAVLARVAEIEVKQGNSGSTRFVKIIESYSSRVTLPESENFMDVETDDVVAQVKLFNKINGFINISNNS